MLHRSDIDLPDDLENRAVARFEKLHDEGRILYEPTEPEYFTDENGFILEFRICPFMRNKPIKGPKPAERNTAEGPFVNPKPDEIIASVGARHRILLNIYCPFKPMLLVTTTSFERQNDPLNRTDIGALWSVMKAMKTPQVGFYNCGVYSGSSQGHKHMQLFPKPDPTKFELFPSKAKSATVNEIVNDLAGVPFKHFIYRIPENAMLEDVILRYEHLLDMTLDTLREAKQGTDHNVVLTTEWILLIPRSILDWGGPWGSNAMGMLGMICVRSQEERKEWAKLGYTKYLRELGISRA